VPQKVTKFYRVSVSQKILSTDMLNILENILYQLTDKNDRNSWFLNMSAITT
jgi:hypothetical protein